VALADSFGRVMQKLRVSLTDRCNFRCVYCMPQCPTWKPRSELLSFEELRRLVALFVKRFGVGQIRLTGGEPLVRAGVPKFVAMLAPLRECGLQRLSLSSNGVMLPRLASALARAGLDDVNVSLDSLSPARFARMTGGGDVREVIRGIDAARAAGLAVKVNAVVIRGINDVDVIELAQWACDEAVALRFIEFMPLDARGFWSAGKVVTESEIIARLSQRFTVARLARGNEPAVYYLLDGKLRLGVISTVSRPFCAGCDRIRFTAAGQMFSCLFAPAGADLRGALRNGESEEELAARIADAVWRKPRGFIEWRETARGAANMNVLGG
jgi:cyclic pyranopterin phosphate synthase